jgi:hypothetical protein
MTEKDKRAIAYGAGHGVFAKGRPLAPSRYRAFMSSDLLGATGRASRLALDFNFDGSFSSIENGSSRPEPNFQRFATATLKPIDATPSPNKPRTEHVQARS